VIGVPALTVIVLTRDEEQFIGRCLSSVGWADEVIVLDSGSSDRTREIATSLGANVYEQEWLGYARQRNKAISLAKNDWVFFIDCDEIVTPKLARSIQEVISGPMDERDGYSVDRRGDFLGLLLPNMSNARNRRNFVRLFNRRYSTYDPEMKVHEEVRFTGKAIPLRGVLIHWRAYTMDEYITVFNRYATMEAEILDKKGHRANGFRIFVWPILRFLWNYVAKGGARLGTRGLIHAMLQATSEYVRYAKLWEIHNAPRMLHPPAHIYRDTPAGASPMSQQAEERASTQHQSDR
jgi:glycosyltransferase involved in cell wall biosynthesis